MVKKILNKLFNKAMKESTTLSKANSYIKSLERLVKDIYKDRDKLLIENEKLRREIDDLRKYKIEAEDLKKENKVLRGLLKDLIKNIDKLEIKIKDKTLHTDNKINKPVETISENVFEQNIVNKPVTETKDKVNVTTLENTKEIIDKLRINTLA